MIRVIMCTSAYAFPSNINEFWHVVPIMLGLFIILSSPVFLISISIISHFHTQCDISKYYGCFLYRGLVTTCDDLCFNAVECFLYTLLSGAEARGTDAFLKSLPSPVPSFAEGRHHLFIHMLSLTSPRARAERGRARTRTRGNQFSATASPKGARAVTR